MLSSTRAGHCGSNQTTSAATLLAKIEPEISAGDAQTLAAAYDRALGPAAAFERASSGIARVLRPLSKP